MKKIMFDDKFGLTQAVLEGQKTMTRRFLKQNYESVSCMNVNYEDHWHGELDGETFELLPRFQVGETVAIAQSYSNIFDEADKGDYFADCYEAFRQIIAVDTPGWKNKMFVRADVMPHHIRITKIEIERLQDISYGDCIKEGVIKNGSWRPYNFALAGFKEWFETPVQAFAALIDKVSGKGTWERNPWVFAYSFERID